MKDVLTKRAKKQTRSFIRKILDLTQEHSIISFAGGLPDSKLFPISEIKEEIKNTLNLGRDIFQYSSAQGLEELRVELSKKYANTNKSEVLITSGSQQGLDLICKTFIDAGDTIVVESPSYLAALNLFNMFEADIVSVNLTSSGVDIVELENIFKTKDVKFFYTIPTFQNPTSWCWDAKTKENVSKLAKKYKVIIIEDSPYNELRYDEHEGKNFDQLLPDLTISLCTFSKTLAPDFRIGWIRAQNKYIKKFQYMKENSDLQSSKFFQYVAANMIKNGKLALHVKTLIKEYKRKRDCMAYTLKKEFGDSLEFEIPQGGMFFWIKFDNGTDTMELFKFAIKQGVAFVPGEVFFNNQKSSSYARLNFTSSTCEEIKIGTTNLKEAYKLYKYSL